MSDASMSARRLLRGVVAWLACVACLATAGCGGSDSAASSIPVPPQLSAEQRTAVDAVLAELGAHWLEGPDGWTTARWEGTSFAQIHYLQQVRNLKVRGVRSFPLSESDKLNGFEWSGEVSFELTPAREAGEGLAFGGIAGIDKFRRVGGWTPWTDYQHDAVPVSKRRGTWDVSTDNSLLRGRRPTPEDFKAAGVN